MARYIDADKFIAELEQEKTVALEFEDGVAVYEIEHTMNLIGMQPTAAVVPKGEYDAVVSAVDNSTKAFLKLHDDYQEAKREVDRLNAVMKEMDEQRAYTINMLGESLEKAKSEVVLASSDAVKMLIECHGYALTHDADIKKEVAREIFEEIEEWFASNGDVMICSNKKFAEIKNKFTEGV